MPYVNESAGAAFKKVLDFINFSAKNFSDTKNSKYSSKNSVGLRSNSIMSASKDLVMSFPVLCSDAISASTACMVSKAIERNCVTTLQLLFSATYLSGNNGQEVLKKFHNNIKTDINMDDFLDIVDSLEGMKGYRLESKTYDYRSNNYPNLAVDMVNEVKLNNSQFYPVTSFSETSINSYEISQGYNGRSRVSLNVLKEALGDNDYINVNGINIPRSQAEFDANERKAADERQRTANSAAQSKTRSRAEKEKFEFEQNKYGRDYAYRKAHDEKVFNQDKAEFDYRVALDKQKAGGAEFFRRQLLDQDVKKFNELVPSMIIVRYNVTDPSNRYNMAIEQEFIAGVKTRLIPVTSEEIIDRLNVLFVNKPSRLNWVRATTGEISFMKDFVLGLDQAKIDAKRDSKLSKTSPIWRSLQYRSSKSGINRLRKNKANDAGAITTLVITQEEVNYLKQNFGVDLSNPTKAAYVLEQYNFMGLVIVDETFEVARFLFDGGTYFEDLSFASLEKETGDNSYKKVVNLISKINRG